MAVQVICSSRMASLLAAPRFTSHGNTGLQAAAVEAAVQGTPCGHGRLLLACGRLAELAEAKTGSAAALSGSAATSGACNSEAADETAPLNVFSNPLYTCATPKHVC